jgi:hypothetical protein
MLVSLTMRVDQISKEWVAFNEKRENKTDWPFEVLPPATCAAEVGRRDHGTV